MFNLLIVDDDTIVREGLKEYVDWSSLGFNVIDTVESAERAREIIEEKEVHAILTDIVMDKKSGITLIKEVTEIKNDLKCIILSGYGEFDYAKEAINLGVTSYLTKPVDFDELEEVFNRVKKELMKNNKIEQIESVEENEIESSSNMIIDNIKLYINEHYGDTISLNVLAEMSYVHPIYLSSLFKEKTGENFIEYLSKVRIKKAKKLLKDMSLRICDVSRLVGYDSPKHFTRVFKEQTGITPSEYKNKYIE